MSSRDRRAAARRKAWGRGPMILRFEPAGGGDGLSVSDPGNEAPAEPSTTQPMIGLRLLADDFPKAEIQPSACAASEDTPTETPSAPSPRVRRVIAHKAHTQAPSHHLRVFEPADTRATKRSRVPVSPS